MKKLSFIYLSAFIFIAHLQGFPFFFHTNSLSAFQELKKNLMESYKNQDLVPLTMSYLLGETKGLSPQIKTEHKLLNLQHLFTPSGVHLSAFLLLFWPFKKSKKFSKFYHGLILTLSLLCFCLPDFYPLKRIALLRLLTFIKNLLNIPLSSFTLFIITFSLDFIFGFFAINPSSFFYSYLFLGIIITLKNQPVFKTILALWGGQIMVSLLQGSTMMLGSLLFSPLLTFIFTLLFIPMVLSLQIGFLTTSSYIFLEKLVETFVNLTHFFTHLKFFSIPLKPNILIPLLILILLSNLCFKTKKIILIISLLLMTDSSPKYFFPPIEQRTYLFSLPSKKESKSIKWNDQGIEIKTCYNKCQLKYQSGVWWPICRKKKRTVTVNCYRKLLP
ncbi:MAG: hypothetical protein KBD63_03925 [Bacteriovoracaceae bacterium]|nr:hypothetical protein [Bacteriovoracaceae bacterium]